MPAQWFSVRSVFKLPPSADGQRTALFEERVVVFRAASPEEALKKGRIEAARYSEGDAQPKLLEHIVAFCLWEAELSEGTEVWSCLRQIDLSEEEFLEHVYRGEQLGLRHLD